MSNKNITSGIALDCTVFNESIGAEKDLILVNYSDFDLEQTSSIYNRQTDDSLGNLRGLTNIFLKPGAVQHIFEGTDYSVVPTVTPEVREDGNLWYIHSIAFTVYSKKSEDRETLISLSRATVVAITKDRSSGLYEIFGMYQGLKVSGIDRTYTGSANSNFYQVSIATPDINIIKEPSLSELSVYLDNGTILPPGPTPGVYGDATPTVQGLVRVDSLETNPIVYLKSTIDSLFAKISNILTTESLLESNKTSTSKWPSAKSIVDWIVSRFEPKITPSDITKYYAGDKTWQTLDKNAVGLGNVDNTSDADKPVPDAVIVALEQKADLVGGKVPVSQLPSYVSDVLEFADVSNFPPIGTSNTIYVAISPSNFQYRWSGTSYIQITDGGIATTDDLPEGTSNLYFTITRFLQELTFARIISALGFTPENSSNKQNSLTPDGTGTKFATVDAVNSLASLLDPESYVRKQEGWDLVVDYGALLEINQITLIDNRSSISLVGLATDVKSVQQSGEFTRTGKPLYFKNRTDHDVTLWHLSGTGNVKFFFPSGENLIVEPNEVIVFNINNNDTSDVRAELVGSIPKAPLHASTHEQGGSDEIQGQNLKVQVIPSVQHYSPVNETLKGHLNGIDTKLGQLNTTTAGLLNRVFFTGDVVTVNGTNFYSSSLLGQGTAISVVQTLSVNDDQKLFFTQDLLSTPFTEPTIGTRGTYIGQLTVNVNPNSANQEFGIEVYRTDILGNPIPSGVSGAIVGHLGVTVLAIIDSGQLQLDANQLTSLQISGMLMSNVTLNVGERIRYHVYARKIGTAGGPINMSVYYGNAYNTYYDTPAENTTDSVINKSTAPGITTTDVLIHLEENKAVKDTQIEIGSNSTVDVVWNSKTILFTSNCTITVPSSLITQFGFVFRTLAGVTVTWAITAPFTWETTPSTTPEKTTGSFMRRGSTNTILLDF